MVYVRDSMYTDLQAQADVAHKGTSDPNLIEATIELSVQRKYRTDLNTSG